MTSNGRLARWWRFAVIAAIALMAATLLGVVWSTQRAIRSASDTVIRGEVAALNATLRGRLMERGDQALADRLSDEFASHVDDGLRYVALLDGDGALVAEAGEAPVDLDELAGWKAVTPNNTPTRVGGRVRAWFGRTRPRDPADPRPAPPYTAMILEVEPQVANQLAATSRRLLVIGVLAALTLTALAAVLVRWSLRREQAVRAVEQARHLATLGQMSAVLAHEIRNPLASLKGNAQLLAGSLPAGDKPRAKADRVVDEATRLESLTNDLLEFARTGELHVREIDPGGLVRDAAAAVDASRIVVDDAAAPRTWPLDADRIRQVLVNLLENAVACSDGPVRAIVARDEKHLILTVRDTGPGIPAADLPHLFEPFFTRRTRGTGLGLAVAKRFVELHGGTITADNAVGSGAELRITLPRQEGSWRAS